MRLAYTIYSINKLLSNAVYLFSADMIFTFSLPILYNTHTHNTAKCTHIAMNIYTYLTKLMLCVSLNNVHIIYILL